MTDQQTTQNEAHASQTLPVENWGSAVPAAVPPQALDQTSEISEPHRERLALVVKDNLLDLKGNDSAAIVAIHNRQTFSNDLQATTLNIMTTIFVLFGSSVVVFGPQSKATSLLIGLIMFVAACGTFGFSTFTLKGFGINATAGQAGLTNGAASGGGWIKFFGGVLVGIVLSAAVLVLSERL